MADRFVIWGSAGHAKVLADLVRLRGGRVIALFDNQNVTSALAGVPVHVGQAGFTEWLAGESSPHMVSGLVAIGGSRGRDRIGIQGLFYASGLQLPAVVHPDAVVSTSATLGSGTQVLAQAIIAADVRMGNACIVNHRASVDHECRIGNGVHLAPSATLCGCITLGDNVFVGAGATVLPRLTIGADATVGAGAVVTRDVPPGAVVIGNPARQITRERGST